MPGGDKGAPPVSFCQRQMKQCISVSQNCKKSSQTHRLDGVPCLQYDVKAYTCGRIAYRKLSCSARYMEATAARRMRSCALGTSGSMDSSAKTSASQPPTPSARNALATYVVKEIDCGGVLFEVMLQTVDKMSGCSPMILIASANFNHLQDQKTSKSASCGMSGECWHSGR